MITGRSSFAEMNLDRRRDLPSRFSLDSLVKAWLGSEAHGFRGLNHNFWNSARLAVPATLLSATLGSMNGYVLSKWRFRGSDSLFTLILFGMFIPYQSILIPLVQVPSRVGLYGSITGLLYVTVVYGIPLHMLTLR